MNAVSEDVADMLVATSGLALVKGTNLFTGREPPSPADSVTVFDTPVRGPALTLAPAEEQYYYGSVQVRVRNSKQKDAWGLIHDIRASLHGRINEVWGSMLYTSILCSGGPAPLDYDENNRIRLIINFEIQRREQ